MEYGMTITETELLALAVYAAMAGYIMYQQHLLKKRGVALALMVMCIEDVARGTTTVEIKHGRMYITHKGKTGSISNSGFEGIN